ncbi:ATP:cob(I)alamin adenosyltransferase [Candidatus Gottesmanbacteria bacterium RIFCSPLOWO2_01_FULL_39_12b]|uniref:Corrinoid adenosyltransferase n=1 Tax=Candidatus Gottesmanbacteria bacterium RIFCSPLOWO2_01_FULL_39_12b TaxID=1798388 RepID=A0A1F6AM07_9BACT|nr:MAG: ATP:cob(I)alamin adenosyltransferase [Candidatus Gottesmanbacteria bacterium RIFCSPLOWO2_01_FULL_39_12b]
MKIYTRTGDQGQTSLYGGKRVEKHNLQVVSYGTVDELNSVLGVLISHLPENQQIIYDFLQIVQNDLFTIGSHLSGKRIDLGSIGKRVGEMEKMIDAFDKSFPVLKNFILPGGTREASFSHLARSVCRRAEREVIRLSKENDVVHLKRSRRVDKKVIVYLNRLSDLLFVVARYLNLEAGSNDVIWKNK